MPDTKKASIRIEKPARMPPADKEKIVELLGQALAMWPEFDPQPDSDHLTFEVVDNGEDFRLLTTAFSDADMADVTMEVTDATSSAPDWLAEVNIRNSGEPLSAEQRREIKNFLACEIQVIDATPDMINRTAALPRAVTDRVKVGAAAFTSKPYTSEQADA